MSKYLILSIVFAAIAFLCVTTDALAQTAPISTFLRNAIPFADDTYYLGTTTPSTKAWKGLIVNSICLNGSCRSSWPSGGAGGSTSTSTSLVSGRAVFATGVDTIGTDTGFLFNSTSDLLTFTYGSTTALSGTTLCIGSDCRTSWPASGGGTGSIATSTSEIAGQLAYWTSTGATPATLGKVATSSLGIALSDTTGTLAIARGGTGATTLDELITLGTHTTGTYLATLSSSGSLTVGNSGSESAAVTVNLNTGNANIWTALQTFSYTGTTTFSGGIQVGTLVGAPYFNATSTTATSTFAGGLQTVTGYVSSLFEAARFVVKGISAAFTPSVEGELGFDTTSSQLKFYSGGAVRVLAPYTEQSFTVGTTTAWTGTTTIPLAPAAYGQSWDTVRCFTDVGTLGVAFDDGTNAMNYFQASTTVGTVILTTNTTFTASEKRYVKIGTPASSPTYVSCTISKTINAD